MNKRIIGERYELQDRIGAGGMAEVYLALDHRLGRQVAVKVLYPAYAADPAFVERFRREARAAAALNHPHIAAVYDWGADGDTYYMVMEYVPGGNLKEALREHGPCPEGDALRLGAQIASALEAAHRQGVIHRDVKPHNVLLDLQKEVKVVDFGIARAAGATHLTQTMAVLGSAHYLSPEQAQRQSVDFRSDLYNLGVVLYELLTGQVPFTGDSPLAIAWQHVHQPPTPPSAVRPGIAPATEAVVLKALAKDPLDRYQDAAEMRQALEQARVEVAALPAPTLHTLHSGFSSAATGAMGAAGAASTAPAAARTPVVPGPTTAGAPAAPVTRAMPPVAPAAPARATPAARSGTGADSVTTVAPAVPAASRRSAHAPTVPVRTVPAPGPAAGAAAPAAPARPAAPTGRRPFLLLAALLALALLSLPFGLWALGGRTDEPPAATPGVVATQAPPVPTPAPSATAQPTAEPTAEPTAAPTVAPTAAPTLAPTPAPTLAPTPRPTTAPAAQPGTAAASPVDAVVGFYESVAQRQFDRAAQFWSARMQASYPPAENINGRFSQTQRLSVDARIVSVNEAAGSATVAIDLVEVVAGSPTPRRFVGTWQLVRGPSGWLLDQPNLRAA